MVGWLKSLADKPEKTNKGLTKIKIVSWGNHLKHIREWQKENARDQWVNAKYGSKKLYQYSWMSDVPIELIHEKHNEFDNQAIIVVLNGYDVGYIPRPTNREHFNQLLKLKNVTATVRGGDSKFKDQYGDIVKINDDPVVEIEVEL